MLGILAMNRLLRDMYSLGSWCLDLDFAIDVWHPPQPLWAFGYPRGDV